MQDTLTRECYGCHQQVPVNLIDCPNRSCRKFLGPYRPGASATVAAATEAAGGGPIFDKAEQLQKIQAALLPGETIEAVLDMKGGGTGFLGITTKRLIFYDKSFLRKMKAMVSIPYSRVVSVAAQDESGLLTGRGFFSSSQLHVMTANSEHEFDFRGADKAHLAHQLIIAHLVD